MVIPIGGLGVPLAGPPPPELVGQFEKIKICVLAMIGGMIGKLLGTLLIGADVVSLLVTSINLILNTIVGIFLLKDDHLMGRAHSFMLRTCCQTCADQCGGGMSCLMPFVLCNLITICFDVLLPSPDQGVIAQLIALFDQIFTGVNGGPVAGLGLAMFAVGTLAAFVGQVLGCWFGWQAYKVARDLSTGFQGGGDWASGGGSAYPRAAERQEAREAMPAAGFQPFTGGGNRLGSG